MLPKKIQYLIAAGMVLAALASPIWENSTMTVRADMVALNVCWKKFGPFFPMRWNCESTIKQNMMAFAFACAFKKDDINDLVKEVCAETEKVSKEQDEIEKANAAADTANAATKQ